MSELPPGRWVIYVCPSCGHAFGYPGVCAGEMTRQHADVTRVPLAVVASDTARELAAAARDTLEGIPTPNQARARLRAAVGRFEKEAGHG